MEALRIEGLSKIFGGVRALDNVSFSVEVGETLAIIGPNGAGKTTLFNVLNGQLSASSGRIYFYGKEITNLVTHRRAHLGQSRSFQITSLFLPLTILENCLLALHGKQPSRFQMFRPMDSYQALYSKAQEVLSAVDLWDKRNKPVRNISYGDQRKLEIALSLASEPKLLLLDEPSAGLTAGECTGIIETIHNWVKEVTTIIVDHDMSLVFELAKRIIVLHYGKIIAEGTPSEIRVDAKVRSMYMGTQEGVGNVSKVG